MSEKQNSEGQLSKDGTAKYYQDGVETIVKFERIYGTKMTAIYCEMTAMKYLDRLGLKEEQPIEKEMIKVGWYRRKATELRNKIDTSKEISYKKIQSNGNCQN